MQDLLRRGQMTPSMMVVLFRFFTIDQIKWAASTANVARLMARNRLRVRRQMRDAVVKKGYTAHMRPITALSLSNLSLDDKNDYIGVLERMVGGWGLRCGEQLLLQLEMLLMGKARCHTVVRSS
jgi:hypothetical protein